MSVGLTLGGALLEISKAFIFNVGDAEMKEFSLEVGIERCDWAILGICGLLFLKGLCTISFFTFIIVSGS